MGCHSIPYIYVHLMIKFIRNIAIEVTFFRTPGMELDILGSAIEPVSTQFTSDLCKVRVTYSANPSMPNENHDDSCRLGNSDGCCETMFPSTYGDLGTGKSVL